MQRAFSPELAEALPALRSFSEGGSEAEGESKGKSLIDTKIIGFFAEFILEQSEGLTMLVCYILLLGVFS